MLRAVACGLVAASLLWVAGCVPDGGVPSAGSAASSAPASSDIGAVVDSLQRSLDDADRRGFAASFDPAIAREAVQLYLSLRELDEVELRRNGPLALSVRWRIPGDHRELLDFVPVRLDTHDGQVVITELLRADEVPIWRLGRTVVRRTGAGSVIAMAAWGDEAIDEWAGRLEAAVDILRRTDLGPLDDDWNSQLVVELPFDVDQYRVLAGTDGGGGVTWCPQGVPRVVLSPQLDDTDRAYRETVLVHEGVHVAAGHTCDSTAPMWMEEGLAEWVAAEHDPATAQYLDDWVDAYLEANPVPEKLPRQHEFEGTEEQVSAVYALSRLAVEVAVEGLGQEQAMAYLDAHRHQSLDEPDDATTKQITAWYVEELERRAAAS